VQDYKAKHPLPEIDLAAEMARLDLHPKPLDNYRRFSKEAIDHFGLQLVESGVLIPFRDGPRTLGYSIRQVNKLPKYLNSTDFRKSEYLYGLWENELYIAEAPKAVYVVEGQFDCIRMWDSGFRNVVSTLGATMSTQQANILTYWVSKIIVVYDGDDKGRTQAKQIKEKYSALFNIQIIDLPEGADPDTADLKNIINNGETNDRVGTSGPREGLV
jgi:DNA primase